MRSLGILSWTTLHLVACIQRGQDEPHAIQGKANEDGPIASSFLETALGAGQHSVTGVALLQASADITPFWHLPIKPALTQYTAPASDPTYMARELDLLQSQIEATKATEQALDTENGALQKELDGWKSSGQRVAKRESHIVDMIHRLRGEQKASMQHSQTFVSLLEQKLQSTEPERPSLNAMFYALAAFAFTATILCSVALSDAPGKDKWTCGTWSLCAKPVWRQVGMGRYVLEVSELQVCLPDGAAHGDLCVGLQAGGNGRPLRTRSADVLTGSNLLAYRDVFTFDLRSSDGPCTFSIADRDTGPGAAREPLAQVALPSQEVLRLAQKDRGEYFRFDLVGLEGCSEKPYLAMRIRDITAVAPHGAAQVQRDGVTNYHSPAH